MFTRGQRMRGTANGQTSFEVRFQSSLLFVFSNRSMAKVHALKRWHLNYAWRKGEVSNGEVGQKRR